MNRDERAAEQLEAAAEQEAERRFPNDPVYEDYGRVAPEVRAQREAFVDGAEWATNEGGSQE